MGPFCSDSIGIAPMTCACTPRNVAVSSRYCSPWSSAVSRRFFRVGNAAPTPQRIPFVRSNNSGSPRTMNPPNADSSMRSLISAETMPSSAKSARPVPAPSSSFAVGIFTMPRTANAAGCWWRCEARLIFAPTQRSPRLLPDQPSVTNGYSLTTPPKSLVPKSGRTSRSMRLTTVKAPNSSTRSRRPTPKVSGQFETSVKPCS